MSVHCWKSRFKSVDVYGYSYKRKNKMYWKKWRTSKLLKCKHPVTKRVENVSPERRMNCCQTNKDWTDFSRKKQNFVILKKSCYYGKIKSIQCFCWIREYKSKKSQFNSYKSYFFWSKNINLDLKGKLQNRSKCKTTECIRQLQVTVRITLVFFMLE
jgi:hypothetical protein